MHLVLLRQDTGDHVHLVHRRHRDEKIGAPHLHVGHGGGAGAVGTDGQDVKRILHRFKLHGVLIDHHHLVSLVG